MSQDFAIWTPVIVAQLNAPRKIIEEKIYDIEKVFRSIEDLKIKVRNYRVQLQGLSVEVQIKLDILCLLEDLFGSMHLVSREETLRQRIPATEFDNILDREKELSYYVKILGVSGQGEMKGTELRITCFLDYTILATREEVVRLSEGEAGEVSKEPLQELLNKLKQEVSRVGQENEELRRKIFFYERDISSLKKGIRKAEKHNAILNKEVSNYQQLVEQLRDAIKEKEMRLSNYENGNYILNNQRYINNPADNEPLGSRIKRMFMNNQ